MSIIDFIEKLQKKPKYVRSQIMWICVFVCMIFIVGFWFISLKHSLSEFNKTDTDQESTDVFKDIKDRIPSLTGSLKTNIESFFDEDIEMKIEKEFEQTMIEEKENIDEEIEKIAPNKLPLAE